MQDKLFQFPQIYTLEASAGSGKTYALAKRYIQLLINPHTTRNTVSVKDTTGVGVNPRLNPEEIPLNSILAITFTNKAATEMKERILEFLRKIALDKFDDPKEMENIVLSLGVDKAAAQKKAYKIMDYLMRNFNFFQVQTIDSFINTILSGCAFKLNLSANFKTNEDYRQYLAYSLDKLIDRAGQDKDTLKLFHNFIKYYIYIENKTSWFPKDDILLIVSNLFSKVNRHAGEFIHDDIEAKDLVLQRKDILKQMRKLRRMLPAGTNKRFADSLSVFLERNEDNFNVDNLSDYFKREDFPLNKDNDLPLDVKKLWSSLRDQIGKLCELEAGSLFNCYIDIFNKVFADLGEISAKEDIMFLESLNREARALFSRESFLLPELYYRLACRFKHFLIDEFQDTSKLQWDNLLLMIENALSVDGSLFYVGDKKQAIYRFRGGEVSLIDAVKGSFKRHNLIEDSLQTNYRSQKEIVAFNNRVFSKSNIAAFISRIKEAKNLNLELDLGDIEEITRIFGGLSQQHISGKDSGYVRGEYLDYKTKEEAREAVKDRVLSRIDDLLKNFSFKDIAILARKNDEVELLTSWLLEKNIPVDSEKTLNIRENSYIKELVSFLKFLNSPIDNLYFASFVLGDIFSRASGIDIRKIQDFIFSLRGNKRDHVYLYKEFRREFPKEWEGLIESFFKDVGFIPLYELVVSIFNRFAILRNFPEYQGFFMRFLELIKEQEDRILSLGLFLEFFDTAPDDDLYVNVAEHDAVCVLTIHKSKGLEFPVVIIPFLEMNLKVESDIVREDQGALRLFRLKRRYADFSRGLSKIYKEEYIRSFIDELNSIYVAFTRAAEELHIFIPAKAASGPNPACLLLAENNFEAGKRRVAKKAMDKPGAPAIPLAPSEYAQWSELLKDEFGNEEVLPARERILRGEILHYMLSFIGNLSGQDKKAAQSVALLRAKERFSFDPAEYQKLVSRLLEDKKTAPYFYLKDADVYTEKEIVDLYGNTKRIDRLILAKDGAVIIDYKSAKDESGLYQGQVGEYIKAIRDIYPQKKVKGVLLYLDDFKVEEIK